MTKLHQCATPYCHARTRATHCRLCSRRRAQAAKRRAELAAIVGTPLNLGVNAFLDSIVPPDGFTKTRFVETWPDGAVENAKLEGDGITIRIDMSEMRDDLTEFYSAGSGHTTFTSARGERTFDRLGVEDSFYVEFTDTADTVSAKIAAQLARVVTSREAATRQVAVPGLPGGWAVTPERRAEIATKLANGKSHAFTPSGFGTGYSVYGGRRRTQFSKALPPETSAFFAIKGTLYYDTLDCD